ncbi:MAG TPA: DUF2007 domain-containing protein [Acidobacteriota bacterium]|nr:DUF2007 domain-containing protein [Acidobacteriota bacterium]
MFCPKCRSEYIEGIITCTDCGILLVESIPEPEPYKFVEILETFNLADIAVIKSILDDGDIEYFFLGENFNQIEQMAQPARLAVREDQVDEAKEALKDIEVRYLAIASTANGEEEIEKD